MKSVCITGHRPAKLPWEHRKITINRLIYKVKLKKAIKQFLKAGYTHFTSGMALGVDLDFAEIILKLKKKNPNIFLECALPYPDQTKKWKTNDVKRYNRILKSANKITILNNEYTSRSTLERNKYMVDSTDTVIAVWNGIKKGGTWYTIQYATEKGKDIFMIRI